MIVEIACNNFQSCQNAEKAGANRIELIENLKEGAEKTKESLKEGAEKAKDAVKKTGTDLKKAAEDVKNEVKQ